MRVGSIVKWKYSEDVLFIVVSMTGNPFMSGASVVVRPVRKLFRKHSMFVSDLEVVC